MTLFHLQDPKSKQQVLITLTSSLSLPPRLPYPRVHLANPLLWSCYNIFTFHIFLQFYFSLFSWKHIPAQSISIVYSGEGSNTVWQIFFKKGGVPQKPATWFPSKNSKMKELEERESLILFNDLCILPWEALQFHHTHTSFIVIVSI